MKKIKYILIGIIIFILLSTNVEAASLALKSSYPSITKGSSVTVTATVSSNSPIVSIEGTLMCKGAGVNSGINMEFDDVSNSLYSKSYKTTVKATSTGTITCTVIGARLTDMASDSWNNISDKSISIQVKAPAVIAPKEYSSNNNLSSLKVDDYTLSPEFSKDVKEYTVEVPNGTEKVTITASKEDNTAMVKGIGEVNVSEGTNKIEVKVTAENGNVKTYVINVIVKELEKVEVVIDNKTYTIIRKEGVLEVPENYEKSSIKIGDEEVLCYQNIATDNIIIGLKDAEGISRFYSYDEERNIYEIYNGYKIGGVNLLILEMPTNKVPEGYQSVSFNYNNDKLEGYQYIEKNVTYAANETVEGNYFYLIYAVNEISGEQGLYVYDKLEETVQRYNSNLFLSYQEKIDHYFLYLLIAVMLLAVTLIALMLVLMKKKKNNRKLK